jgi:transcriptional regulator with XRE-family HTH domain
VSSSSARVEQNFLSREDIHLLRRKRDWTLRDLAARVGVSPSHLCLIEQGKRDISAPLALRLLRVLMLGDTAVTK